MTSYGASSFEQIKSAINRKKQTQIKPVCLYIASFHAVNPQE